ncbi:MAG: hypothetical protein BGO43_11100 [Gammaproteobacteria bacterium 39-13]|nr:flagellar hook-length control protein FliK [Gammaproteobacteria bacterium]OJV86584.1 MAG: hypothetical protein BGO43_11100 [Gammaproteobacteria bacterium 39-13]
MDIISGLFNLPLTNAAQPIENSNNLSKSSILSLQNSVPEELELNAEDFSIEAFILPLTGKMMPEEMLPAFECCLEQSIANSLNVTEGKDLSLDEPQDKAIVTLSPLFIFAENDIKLYFNADNINPSHMTENKFLENEKLNASVPLSSIVTDEMINNKENIELIDEHQTKENIELMDPINLSLSALNAQIEKPEEMLNKTFIDDNTEQLKTVTTEETVIRVNHSSLQQETLSNDFLQENPDKNSNANENNIQHNITLENTMSKLNETEGEFKNLLTKEQVIHSKHFDQELSHKIQVMIKADENLAKVNIDPPELGSIEIKIRQEADKTHITFHTSLDQTRDLIESSIFKLRSQMSSQGLYLGDVNVSSGQTGQEQRQMHKNPLSTASLFAQNQNQEIELPLYTSSSEGQLDLYA